VTTLANTDKDLRTDPPAAQADLLEMLAAYTQVTQKLQASHEKLQGEVVRLRGELAAKNREFRRRERLASLGQMAAGLAHEIRNPLGAIALYVSMLEQDLADRPEQARIVRNVAAAVSGLNRLVTSILEFARPREPSRQMVSFSRVLWPAVQVVSPMLEQKRVDLRLPRGDAEVFADPDDLGRALGNLLRNATEAVGTGGVVAVRMRPGRDGAAVIWVEDDGPGVPEEMVDRAFEPFATTKPSGTGLGLAIVHQIVEAHGGRTRLAKSRLGGARVVMRIGPRSRDGAKKIRAA
jgi:two-component system sensor histidine kinase HydH